MRYSRIVFFNAVLTPIVVFIFILFSNCQCNANFKQMNVESAEQVKDDSLLYPYIYIVYCTVMHLTIFIMTLNGKKLNMHKNTIRSLNFMHKINGKVTQLV